MAPIGVHARAVELAVVEALLETSTPHLALVHEAPIAAEIIEAFAGALASEGLTLRIGAAAPNRGLARWPWLAPTIVRVEMLRAYGEEFLKAVGPGHLATLEGAISALVARLEQAGYGRRAGSADDRYSRLFSLWIERDAGTWFKMLAPRDAADADLAAALRAYGAFALAYHGGDLDPEDLAILSQERPVGGVVVMAFHPVSGTIQPVDPVEGRLTP